MEIKTRFRSAPSKTDVFLLLIVCLFFVFAFHVPPAWAQEKSGSAILQSWFDTAHEAERYISIRNALFDIFEEGDNLSIPSSILISKLKEGAVKNVPPPRLLKGLGQELERLEIARIIIRKSGFRYPAETERQEQYLRILNINLRESMSEQLLTKLLKEANGHDLELESGISACSALLQVRKIAALSEDELLNLGTALYSSSIPASRYDSISSIFLRARINRLSEREVLEMAVRVLEKGGGLIQLEREIDRRKRRR